MLQIDIPDNVASAMKLPEKTLKKELKKMLALKLYEKGILGLGKARELADASILEFFTLMKEEDMTLNYDMEELESDLKTLEELDI